MSRIAVLLVLVAGCDTVFRLDPVFVAPDAAAAASNDDDGDDKPNATDPCPHIKDESPTDADGDGISVDCDDDDLIDSQRAYITFASDQLGAFVPQGIAQLQDDYVMLGSPSGTASYLVLPINTGNALVDVEFEIVENAIEDGGGAPWVELGVFTIHRMFTSDLSQRGDNCFYGRDSGTGDAGYLELNEDDVSHGQPVRYTPPLDGTGGWFRHHRTLSRVTCSVTRRDSLVLTGSFDVAADHTAITGAVAVSADRVRARVLAVWVSYK